MSDPEPRPIKKPKKEREERRIKVNSLFPLTPEVDIFLRTSWTSDTAMLFGTTKLFLQAASAVLRDTLSIGAPGETHESIPLIDIDDHPDYVKIFLLYLHPGKLTLPSGKLRALDSGVEAEDLLAICRMAEKYDAPLVLNSALNAYLPFFYGLNDDGRDAINAFGLAVAFKAEFHVEAALRSFDKWKVPQNGAEVMKKTGSPGYQPRDRAGDSSSSDEMEEAHYRRAQPLTSRQSRRMIQDARDFNLSDMHSKILAVLSGRQISEFSRIAGLVACLPGYTWARAAEEFEI